MKHFSLTYRECGKYKTEYTYNLPGYSDLKEALNDFAGVCESLEERTDGAWCITLTDVSLRWRSPALMYVTGGDIYGAYATEYLADFFGDQKLTPRAAVAVILLAIFPMENEESENKTKLLLHMIGVQSIV